jgi:hypothetical protein
MGKPDSPEEYVTLSDSSVSRYPNKERLDPKNKRKQVSEKDTKPEVFVISKEIYLAFHPIERIMAQALQKVGKAKILYDDPKFQK